MQKPRGTTTRTREALPLFAHAQQHAPAAQEARVSHVSTGLASVDALLGGGFATRRLTLIAARPKVGASSFLLGATLEGLRRDVPVLYASEHLTEPQLRGRLVVLEARVNGHRFKAGLASNEDKIALAAARERIGWNRLTLLVRQGLDTDALASAAFSYRPDLVVVDVTPRAPDRGDRFAAMIEGTQALAELARHQGVAVAMRVILPASDMPPTVGELPGQGALLEAVDTALLLHREEVTTPRGGDGDSPQGLAELTLVRLEGMSVPPEHVRLRFDQRFAGLLDL